MPSSYSGFSCPCRCTPFAGSVRLAIKVGNKPEGTYLAWLDVTAVADKIGARKMADDANQQAHDAAMKVGTDYSGRQSLETVRTLTPEDMMQRWMAKNAFVYLNDGSSYGLGGANHMRMNLATSRKTLKAALDSIKDFDTGGLIGVPITIKGNSIPVGRIYRADVKRKQMVPASDWIVLK